MDEDVDEDEARAEEALMQLLGHTVCLPSEPRHWHSWTCSKPGLLRRDSRVDKTLNSVYKKTANTKCSSLFRFTPPPHPYPLSS